MTGAEIIPFDRPGRLVEKARRLVESIDAVLDHPEQAVPILSRAMPHAEDDLKQRIVMVLGSLTSLEAARSLYTIMKDPSQSEEIRQAASVQINITASLLTDTREIYDRLILDLKSPDAALRRNAVFALGWEGNSSAVVPLIELLFDPDTEVQQASVNALTNIKDERILNLLFDRLRQGPLEQKRTILYNVWRFAERLDEVVEIYLEYLHHPDENLRLDALTLLGTIASPEDYPAIYGECLSDRSERIRLYALEVIEGLPSKFLPDFETILQRLTTDPDPRVKATARRVLERI